MEEMDPKIQPTLEVMERGAEPEEAGELELQALLGLDLAVDLEALVCVVFIIKR